jgi:hypothetical protein
MVVVQMRNQSSVAFGHIVIAISQVKQNSVASFHPICPVAFIATAPVIVVPKIFRPAPPATPRKGTHSFIVGIVAFALFFVFFSQHTLALPFFAKFFLQMIAHNTSLKKSGREDLNLQPLDPQSSALPNCAT